ncbi:hypothetical protein WMF30_51575 [Sorangium sp. So ce134]
MRFARMQAFRILTSTIAAALLSARAAAQEAPSGASGAAAGADTAAAPAAAGAPAAGRAAAPGASPEAAPREEEPPSSGPSVPLDARCLALAESRRSSRDFYALCVDAFSAQEGLVSLACKASGREGKSSCEAVGDLVVVNHDFVVYAWHDPGTRAKISLSGTGGNQSTVYRPAGTFELERLDAPRAVVDHLVSTKSFGPRQAGQTTLAVTAVLVRGEDAPREMAKVEQTYTVEAYYDMALRLGIGFSWAPWARSVGVRSTRDGQQYAAVIEGADSGLFSSELVAGVSYFLCDMPETKLRVCGALGLRVGVVTLQDGSSAKVLGSLMVGPEVAIGKDFSAGVFGGVMRHDPPADGYRPGKLLPPGETAIKTRFGLTPAVGLVLNFTPGFLKNVGLQ